MKRVLNKPKRGIGKATIQKLEAEANKQKSSIFSLLETLSVAELTKFTTKKGAWALKNFVEDILDLQDFSKQFNYRFVDEFENLIRIRQMYADLNETDRVLNIDEFYGLVRDYIKQNPGESLENFLYEISLTSDADAIDGEQVSLMSIHAAKGLEFEYVFVIGLEDGYFPLLSDGNDMEEERRLGYVAFTRAKKELVLSYAKSRFFRGKRDFMNKSRFLSEAGLIKGSLKLDSGGAVFKKGDLVKHKVFGMGRVLSAVKSGKEYKLSINFGGSKRDILSNFVEKI